MFTLLKSPKPALLGVVAALTLSGASLTSAAFAASPTGPIAEADVLAAKAQWGAGLVHFGDDFPKAAVVEFL